MKIRSFAALALVAAAVSAAPAAAQLRTPEQSSTRGFTLGLDLNGGVINTDLNDRSMEQGGGVGLTLGYGVSNAFALFLRGTVAYQLAQYDLGARYSFGTPDARLRPYAEGALTYAATREDDLRARGFGATGGAGVEYFLNRKLSLDLGVAYTAGRFTTVELAGEDVDLDESYGSSRLKVGVRWHP